MTRVPVPDPARPRLERRARQGNLSAKGPGRFSVRLRGLLATLAVLCSTLHLGWPSLQDDVSTIRWIQVGLLLCYAIVLVATELPRGRALNAQRLGHLLWRSDSIVVLGGLIFAWWWPTLDFAGALLFLNHAWMTYLWLLRRGLNPGLIFVLSFFVLIVAGAGVLKLPAATPPEQPIGFIDALFTSTSATCVTGLTVRDTGTGFTRFGQVVIVILIQLGGLGTFVFGALVALLLGSSLSLKAVQAIADTASGAKVSEGSIRRLVLFAAFVVFGFEAIGAAVLYFGWPDTWARAPADIQTPIGRAFHSVFFSISAFCNAGFATTPNSVESLRIHWTTHVVIAGLSFIGGLGLPVYTNFAQIIRARLRARRLNTGMLVRFSLHTRMVLWVTFITYFISVLLIFFSQVVQRDVPVGTAVLDAHFMSIATRTAGFDNTTPAGMGPLSRFTLLITMFIGGAPASAAGGIKVIVFGVLVLMAWSAIMNRESVQVMGRMITPEVQRRAAALFMIHLMLVLVIAGVLVVTENGQTPSNPGSDISVFEEMFFESVSGCSTVGMSLGPTPRLSDSGKVAVTVGMFLGRVGSLAFLVALVGVVRRDRARFEYPTEGVVLT